jgi:hypothetical protein
MRKHVQDAIDWMKAESVKPSRDWKNMCQSSARSAWGLAPWGESAKIAWGKVPQKHRHHDLPENVPAGALCFGMMDTKYGHAWIAGRNGNGFSTDYKRMHNIDRAPMNLPAWTKDQKVWWTAWTPFGMLPLDKDEKNVAKFGPDFLKGK